MRPEAEGGGVHHVPLVCWRWNIVEDWPPFLVHRDLYEDVERCKTSGFTGRSRDVRWAGGFNQPEMKTGVYDPLYGNDDSCADLQQYIENNAPNAAQRWAYLNDARFCSDGSFGAYSEDAALFGFNCDLGTHASACGLNRDLVGLQAAVLGNNLSTVLDELQQPTGPAFQSCFDEDVADFECCRAENSFRVSGPTADPTDATLTEDDPHFCYADPAHSTGGCDPQQTSYFRSGPSCEAYCATFDREGRDETCMPNVPECNNWLGPEHWPRDEFVTVSAWCICGPKLESKIEAGSYVSRGSTLWLQNQAGRRRLAEYADAWRWDDGAAQGIDRFHGAHFDVPDPLYDAILKFRTALVPADAECANYFDLLGVPAGVAPWDPTQTAAAAACDAAAPGACCVAHRGHKPMSRGWLQTGDMTTASASAAFASSVPVGTAVHQSEVAAVGDFDGDGHPDIVVGNRLFVSTPPNGPGAPADFAYRAGVAIGSRDFVQVYAGDVNGDVFDDVVGVYSDGSFEVFLTVYDTLNELLASSGGIGFHSTGVQAALVGHTITTINFIGTLQGYGTNCRGKIGGIDWGCTSAQRAVFVGTADTLDYFYVSPDVEDATTNDAAYCLFDPASATKGAGSMTMNFPPTLRFEALAGSEHETLSSARFYADYAMTHQALAVGTGAGVSNSLAFLGIRGFQQRPIGFGQYFERSVSVAAARIAPGVELICFANRDAPNRCVRIPLDSDMFREHKIFPDLGAGAPFPPPSSPFRRPVPFRRRRRRRRRRHRRRRRPTLATAFVALAAAATPAGRG